MLETSIDRDSDQPSKVSLRKIASRIGIHPGNLSRILTGKRKLSFETALAIGVSLNLNEKDIASLLVFAATEDLISTIDKMKASAERSFMLEEAVKIEIVGALNDLRTKISGKSNLNA